MPCIAGVRPRCVTSHESVVQGHSKQDPYFALQDAICQCKQLRTLHIAVEADKGSDRRDASRLLMEFIAKVPNLTVMLWQEVAPSQAAQRTRHISSAFTARVAAENPAGSGLRLLHAEQCSFNAVPPLPTSLRILSLRHEMGTSAPFHTSIAELVAPCAALCELYLLEMTLGSSNVLILPLVAAACPLLQTLVMHVSLEESEWVSLAMHSSVQ